jgi:hypothetical protein
MPDMSYHLQMHVKERTVSSFISIIIHRLTNILDRYDVRLLLESLPEPDAEHSQVRPISPSGWSDLPSDSEDTFFFSPDEVEDYRREKRRRLIDRGREERLKALAAEEGEEDSDPWGGSDEEVLYHIPSKSHFLFSSRKPHSQMKRRET